MTHAKKTANCLRRFLFNIWILALAIGVIWLFLILFDIESFGTGLMGTPSVALIGPLYGITGDLEIIGYIILVIVFLGLFFMTQWFFLCPRNLWKINLKTVGRPMKRSALAAAFAVTLLSIGLLYSILDLFDVSILEDMGNSSDKIAASANYSFLLIPLFLWCCWSIIFCIYWRQSDHYNWAGKVIRALIAGSILELFVAIPVYVTRQDDCYCARGSYTGLVFGTTVLLWAFGPGVFLLFLREKARKEKFTDSDNNINTTTNIN